MVEKFITFCPISSRKKLFTLLQHFIINYPPFYIFSLSFIY